MQIIFLSILFLSAQNRLRSTNCREFLSKNYADSLTLLELLRYNSNNNTFEAELLSFWINPSALTTGNSFTVWKPENVIKHNSLLFCHNAMQFLPSSLLQKVVKNLRIWCISILRIVRAQNQTHFSLALLEPISKFSGIWILIKILFVSLEINIWIRTVFQTVELEEELE